MPYFQKRPSIVEAIEYRPGMLPPHTHLREDGSAYVWNELHKSEINLEPGDMVRVDEPRDCYPIDRAYFDIEYVAVDWPVPQY